jgi:hypothetical protein
MIRDKQDQQGKAAFNERNPHTTKQQGPVANKAPTFTRLNVSVSILIHKRLRFL